ncbi:hypothetical protein [Paraglaciecola sp.]|uniref:hypothetical protein n=1 Tax=Paraglaciecola sp. TaxID=1920173 RepID=UPI0030F388FA
MQITLLKHASFCHQRELDNKALRQQLKEQFGIAGRRLDNFTLCALGAVAKLGSEIHQCKPLSLISCAAYFSIELIQQMLLDMQQGKNIRPLDFVSTVGNAANFYIAKEFAIGGSNIFIGAGEDALAKSLLISSLEAQTNKTGSVLLLVWQESEEQRRCHALLLRDSKESDTSYAQPQIFKDIDDLSKLHTPLVLALHPISINK